MEHSRPFRMRKPAHQAQFFKLLAEVLAYIVTGDNDVGFVSKNEWNPYWKIETGMNVLPSAIPPYCILLQSETIATIATTFRVCDSVLIVETSYVRMYPR